MLEKIYSFGGLDLRSSDINREPNKASDLQNVQLDSRRQIEQRSGFAEDLDVSGTTNHDIFEYRKTRDLLIMTETGLRKKVGATTVPINFGGDAPANLWTEGIDHAEYSDTVYFTDIAGNNELFKYDGYMAYRAGMPQPTVVPISGAGGFYYRIAIFHIDLQGNTTWSDYYQTPTPLVDLAQFTLTTLQGTEFHNKWGSINGAQTLSSVDLDITMTSHNYEVGDFLRVLNTLGEYKILEVVGSTPTLITFSAASVGTDSFDFTISTVLERRTYVMMAKSTDATFGYVEGLYDLVQSTSPTQVLTYSNLSGGVPLNDIYDTGVVRGLPPRSRYITVYGGTTLVLANLADTKNLTTDATDTSPQQPSTINWSSVFSEFGTSVENFLPFYQEIIGTSYEGEITGLFGGSDSLIILKENQLYYMNGVLQELQYRPRSALSERVGCVSHRSIIEGDGGCIFMSKKGIYLARHGQKPIELSDVIEPLFTEDTTGLDFTQSRGVIDFINERIHWFIPATLATDNVVLTFNYYYREWFKHSGIDASQGFAMVDDDQLYHCDGSKVFKRDGSLNDVNTPIDSFYASHWHHLGEPSIRKKFTNFILASLSNLIWDCNIKTQLDWTDTDKTDVTIPMSDTIVLDDKRLNITQAKSCRFIIGNAEKSQGLLLTGYEFVYEFTQETPKGES